MNVDCFSTGSHRLVVVERYYTHACLRVFLKIKKFFRFNATYEVHRVAGSC